MKRFITALAVCLLLCLSAGTTNAMNMSRPSDCYGIPWCGCFARHVLALSDPGKAFNSALRWLDWGHRVHDPHEGDMVVWSRGGGRGHVGMLGRHIRGDVWMVVSGNDGHRARERPRSIANAVGVRRGPTILASATDKTLTRAVLKEEGHVTQRITHTRHRYDTVRRHRSLAIRMASIRHHYQFNDAGGRFYMEKQP